MSEISVIVRVMPNAEDVDIDLPLEASPADIIEEMLNAGLDIPRIDQQGSTISYKLVPKGRQQALADYETLGQAQVQNGDILLMIPQVRAGKYCQC